MKTRERILQTSLYLFNEEGESHVTTVDIANEMDISPGNLYYHFKGKEIIIEALYERFDEQMAEVLSAPIQKDTALEIRDYWFYLYVVFEDIYNYRFLYYNLTDIMQRYEKIRKRFARLLRMKTTTARSLCEAMVEADALTVSSDAELDALVNQIVMTVIYWINFNALNGKPLDNDAVLMHQGVYQVMSLMTPHLTVDQQAFFAECSDLYQELIRQQDV